MYVCVFFFKQKTAYEMRISDWSSDVCSSDLAALYRNGFSAPGWPIDEGGTGWTPAQRYVFQLEVERAEAPHFNQMGVRMVGPLLMKYGTDDQKAFHLPRILEGRTLWCQGFSEPNSGSDLASLRTRAVRQGEIYVINGSKI